ERLVHRTRRVALRGGALAGTEAIRIAVELPIADIRARALDAFAAALGLGREAQLLLATKARPTAHVAAAVGGIARAQLGRAVSLAHRRWRFPGSHQRAVRHDRSFAGRFEPACSVRESPRGICAHAPP